MIETLRRASDQLDRAVVWACIVCLLVMLGISFAGFTWQLITGNALSWTYSLARLFIPWIGMLSITVAFKRGEHVAMAVLLQRLPRRWVLIVSWINVAIIGLFALLLIWFGWKFFANATHINMVSDQIQVHQRWVAASVPMTGLILLVHLVNGQRLLDLAGAEAEVEALLEGEGGRTGAAHEDAEASARR